MSFLGVFFDLLLKNSISLLGIFVKCFYDVKQVALCDIQSFLTHNLFTRKTTCAIMNGK